MHLVNAARSRMTCIPVVHEASAVIAAEYFNQVCTSGRAYALVTAGPGVTNALTGMAGAFLESRNVLVLAGQVKSADLSRGEIRQRGIQELDGLAMASPVSVASKRFEMPESDDVLEELVSRGLTGRQGPVYLEFCLDAQGAPTPPRNLTKSQVSTTDSKLDLRSQHAAKAVASAITRSSRPVLLIGGGVSHDVAIQSASALDVLGVPLMTTWNGFDRIADDHPRFAGRPNTWGQRSANILLAQSDCIVALGTRLGIQQTGFNWQEWGPRVGEGLIIQVEIDPAELQKGHPRIDLPLEANANAVLVELVRNGSFGDFKPWWDHISKVRSLVPLRDPENSNRDGFISPYDLIDHLSDLMKVDDILVPASSGSGQFVPMEIFRAKSGQRVITNKGLASMGYGLAAAVGAALATNRRVVLVEGDGSFSQSIQELGTLAILNLPVKIFLLDNDGYASIRTTQRNYFNGAYIGCDSSTGLGFPDWALLAKSFGIPSVSLNNAEMSDQEAIDLFNSPGPGVFLVKVDPDQTYFPKVTSQVAPDGSMKSNPIHLMSPPLAADLLNEVFLFRNDMAS